MRPVPRRLRHGEEATLVEHLGELRARIFIMLLAVVAAFVVTYTFHGRILNWLNRPLPEHLRSRPPSARRAVISRSWSASGRRLLIALPIVVWQLWAFLAPPSGAHAAAIAVFAAFAAVLLVGGHHVRLLRRAPGGGPLPDQLRLAALRRPDPGARTTTRS